MPSVINGPAIRRAYEDKGLTRAKFAEVVDLSPKAITNITAPDGGVCSRAAAARIAEVLGWDIGDVIEDAPDSVSAAESEADAATNPGDTSDAQAGTRPAGQARRVAS